MLSLLSDGEVSSGKVHVCTPSQSEFSVVKEFLLSFLSKLDYSNVDELFIVADRELVNYLCTTQKNKITDLFYFITPLKSNLESSREELIELFYKFKVTLFLNKEIQLFGKIDYYNPKEVKNFLNFGIRIVDAIHFETFCLDAELYNSVVGR